MFFYTIRRLIGAVALLIVMSIVTFLLFYATPTDPARLTCGKNCTPTGIENNRKYLGLDKSLSAQYFDFVGGIFHERKFPADPELQKARPDLIVHCKAPCLGYSPLHNEEVWTYLKPKLPVTISLVIGAFLLWIISGVLLGIVAALFKGRFLDRFLVSGALLFYSFPTFFISLLLLQLVVFQFNWMTTPTYVGVAHFGSFLYNIFLPCLTLALVTACSRKPEPSGTATVAPSGAAALAAAPSASGGETRSAAAIRGAPGRTPPEAYPLLHASPLPTPAGWQHSNLI